MLRHWLDVAGQRLPVGGPLRMTRRIDLLLLSRESLRLGNLGLLLVPTLMLRVLVPSLSGVPRILLVPLLRTQGCSFFPWVAVSLAACHAQARQCRETSLAEKLQVR